MVALAVGFSHRRGAALLGATAILSIPIATLLDGITRHWIGHGFLSVAMWRVVTRLGPGLWHHVTSTMLLSACVLVVVCVAGGYLLVRASRELSRRWASCESIPGPVAAAAGALLVSFLASTPFVFDQSRIHQAIAARPSAHPFCVVGIIGTDSDRDRRAAGGSEVATTPQRSSSRELHVTARENGHRWLTMTSRSDALPPDILVVVVESFRGELVRPDVMPNLWSFASRGIHCQSHVSGGNATTHGMFSLLNGLEAVWFERPVRFSPILNRLFRSAGYEVGFFAGHDVWAEFQMDGFIDARHFDRFEVAANRGLQSDRRAVQKAAAFLDRTGETQRSGTPRLAVLYMYATHAIYHSYAQDQVFQPAADQRLIYPYADSARPRVWNRYKNSARTVDRLLAAVLRDNRVTVVTGDHGESFLEDGTIGHGVRISKYQNMTPAVIHAPGIRPRVVSQLTSHADLLPTLVGCAGFTLSRPETLDGVDLSAAGSLPSESRIIATRNYLDDDVGLLGPWTSDSGEPFAYLASVSVSQSRFTPLHAIEADGDPVVVDPDRARRVMEAWVRRRFGDADLP